VAVQLEYSTARFGRCKLRHMLVPPRPVRGARASGAPATDSGLTGPGLIPGGAWARDGVHACRMFRPGMGCGDGDFGGGLGDLGVVEDWSRPDHVDLAYRHGPRGHHAPVPPVAHSNKRSHLVASMGSAHVRSHLEAGRFGADAYGQGMMMGLGKSQLGTLDMPAWPAGTGRMEEGAREAGGDIGLAGLAGYSRGGRGADVGRGKSGAGGMEGLSCSRLMDSALGTMLTTRASLVTPPSRRVGAAPRKVQGPLSAACACLQ
jgi:hypothetical protein